MDHSLAPIAGGVIGTHSVLHLITNASMLAELFFCFSNVLGWAACLKD